jgi:hypothetical protein
MTTPSDFFESERSRGLIYFIGIHDFKPNGKSVIPGISSEEIGFAKYRTWFTPRGDAEFMAAFTAFAARYNPLVMRYLKKNE